MTFDVDEIFGWVERQAQMGPRRPGSAAGAENEHFLADQLRAFGYPSVRLEPIPITHHEATHGALTLRVGGAEREIGCFPIAYTAFTAASGVEAPVIVADPMRSDEAGEHWRGRIILTEIRFPPLDAGMLTKISLGYHDPDDSLREVNHPATWVRLGWHLYGQAVRYGAVGFIAIVADQPGGSCKMYAPYGFREADILAKPVPGLWVARADGPALLEAARGGQATARIVHLGVSEPAVTHNVVAELPGSGDSEEVMILHCHHDSPFVSPVEDGSGVAVVLAMARHFAETRSLKRRLIVLFTAGHFYGSIGTRTFIEQHEKDLVRRVALEMTIEHIALEAVERDGKLVPTGRPEPTGVFVPFNKVFAAAVLERIVANDLRRAVLLPPEGPLGDFPPTDGGDWYAAGVPVINAISNPVYLLTDDDALQWVDRARLGTMAKTMAEVLELADRLPREAIARVDAPLYRLGMIALKHLSRARTTGFGRRPVY